MHVWLSLYTLTAGRLDPFRTARHRAPDHMKIISLPFPAGKRNDSKVLDKGMVVSQVLKAFRNGEDIVVVEVGHPVKTSEGLQWDAEDDESLASQAKKYLLSREVANRLRESGIQRWNCGGIGGVRKKGDDLIKYSTALDTELFLQLERSQFGELGKDDTCCVVFERETAS